MKAFLGLCSLAMVAVPVSRAELQVPAIFSDHMVLQNGVNVPVWGMAAAGAEVRVAIAGQEEKAAAGADGKWRVDLSPLTASAEPATLSISGDGGAREIKDVLIGEVWLGSGQSNMAMTVSRAKDFEKEKATAVLPGLRVFTTQMQNSATAKDDCKGEWKVCTPETVGSISATGFFFARELHRELKKPVGLVISAVGGTPIDAWLDGAAQRAVPELQPLFAPAAAEPAFDAAKAKADHEAAVAKWREEARAARKAGKPPGRAPRNPLIARERKANVGGLFNGMIAPLIPFAIRGAVWYQGEANSTPEKARFYQHQLPLLVTDWRQRWGAEFPFAWVQLPNFLGNGRDWPTVREAMAKTLRLPKTGMAVTIDIGDTRDIHPKNKQEAGRRLSLWALSQVYGRGDVVFKGPSLASHEERGAEMVVRFSDAEGLKTTDGAPPPAFQIAGEDRAWHPAVARIEGTTVILKADGVAKPVAARYAWENDPKCTLVNAAGLPAAPFRTDAW